LGIGEKSAIWRVTRINLSQVPESGADLTPVNCCNTFSTKKIHQLILQLYLH